MNGHVYENSWINHLSNHNRIEVMTILIYENELQSLREIKSMIIKGLEWFNSRYKMEMHVLEWNSSLDLSQLHKNTLLVIFQQFRYDFIE